jgi:hypothetical protein
MKQIERICPNCGASNDYDRARCSRCGTQLSTLPAPRQAGLPSKVEGASTAALVLGASAFLARTGYRLFRREILPRVIKGLKPKPASEQVIEPAGDDEPDYTVRGWRVWSTRHNDQEASGSEQFEWKIRKTRE